MDTPYEPPTLEELQQALINLLGTTKTKRLDSLNFLANLPVEGPDAQKILLGAIIFVIEKIALEYKVLSPTHSALYNELNIILNNNNKNSLPNRQKFIYLHYFYEFAKEKKLNLTDLKTSAPATSAELDYEFQRVVDNLLLHTPETRAALVKRPDPETLKQKSETISETYEQLCSQRFFNPNMAHKKYQLILKLFNHPKIDELLVEQADAKDINDPKFIKKKYSTVYGALLFIMLQIEKEYEGLTTGSPENSELYKMCREALNINHSSDVPDIDKINFYKDFQDFIDNVKDDKGLVKILESFVLVDPTFFKKFRWPTYFSDAKQFLEKTQTDIETLLSSEALFWSCVKSIMNHAMWYAVGLGFFELSAITYGMSQGALLEIAKKMGKFILQPVGKYALGPVGKYAIEPLGKYALDFIKFGKDEDTIRRMSAGLLVAAQFVYNYYYGKKDERVKECKANQEFHKKLEKELKQHDPKVFKKRVKQILAELKWYKSLIELPSSRIPANVKQRIRKAIIEPTESKIAKLEQPSPPNLIVCRNG